MSKASEIHNYFPIVNDALFQALSNRNRRKILELLCGEDLPQSELQKKLNISQPCASRHLGILSTSKLICSERNGQQVIYSISRQYLLLIHKYIDQLIQHDKFLQSLKKKLNTGLKESIDNL